MTSKVRMLAATLLQEPDHVPVAPDTANMIPCRLTGRPFWDIYLYQDPPLWKAYIDCCKHFGFDGWLPSAAQTALHGTLQPENVKIVKRTDEIIVTRARQRENGRPTWAPRVTVYYVADPPTHGVPAAKIGLPESHEAWEEIEGVKEWPTGPAMFDEMKACMGDAGIIGGGVGLPGLGKEKESVFEYYDHPERVKKRVERQHEAILEQAERIIDMGPDFLMIGVSGYITLNGPRIARELGLRTLREVTALAKKRGVPTHLHCCGFERALVEMAAEESDLNLINPLEPPPMGDCDLAEIKRTFGNRIALMGNLHTTDVMLRGSPEDVVRASRWCIDVAAEGGGFILSTGDQCGRDTPDENIHAMIETARTHGTY